MRNGTWLTLLSPCPSSSNALPAGGKFDFAAYMKDTATSVNAALDAAVPKGYPETLYESMRWVFLWCELCCRGWCLGSRGG